MSLGAIALGLALCLGMTDAQAFQTKEPPQMRGDTAATSQGWRVEPLGTVGEIRIRGEKPEDVVDVNLEKLGYRVPGILDGLGAFERNRHIVRILANHELTSESSTKMLFNFAVPEHPGFYLSIKLS